MKIAGADADGVIRQVLEANDFNMLAASAQNNPECTQWVIVPEHVYVRSRTHFIINGELREKTPEQMRMEDEAELAMMRGRLINGS